MFKKALSLFILVSLFSLIRVSSQCHYLLYMSDSYGDGWNGAYLEVNMDGNFVGNYNCSQSFTLDSVYSNSGAAMEFVFHSGTYDNEISFTIMDPIGDTLLDIQSADNLDDLDSFAHTSNSICQINTNPNNGGICGVYTLELFDSYGDGWDGAYLDLVINGIPSQNNITLQNGNGPFLFTFTTDSNDVIDLLYTGGFYDNENTYNLIDQSGNLIESNGRLGFNPNVDPTSTFGIVACPSCPSPNSLTANNITPISFDLNWIPSGNETQWIINYNGTDLLTNTIPTTINNLTSNTSYNCYVRAVCSVGDTSIQTSAVNFTTGCGYTLAPFIENFDAGFLPCWSQELVTDDFDWTINAGGTPSSVTGPSDDLTGGAYYIYIETSSPIAQGDRAIISTPTIDLSSLTSPELSFSTHMYGSNIDSLIIDITNNSGSSYTTVFTKYGNQGNQWDDELVDLSSYSGNVQFRITGTRGASYRGDIAIDEFSIIEAPTCPSPDSLIANNVTPTSAELNWTPTGNETQWIINYNGIDILTNTIPTTINNLNSNTVYNCYVRAFCSAGDTSIQTSAVNFTTGCSYALAPLIENFDSGFSPCWSQESVIDDFDWTLDNNGTPSGGTGPSDDVSIGGNYMYTEASSPRTIGDFAIIYSEQIDLSNLANPQLSFYTHMFGSAIGELQIDMFDGSSYVTIFNKVGDFGNIWVEETILLNAISNYVSFRIIGIAGNSFRGDIAIDEFSITEAPSPCGTYTLDLLDSNANGWNGASLDIVINGNTTQNITIQNGTGGLNYHLFNFAAISGAGTSWSQTGNGDLLKSDYPGLSDTQFIEFVASEVNSQSNVEAAVLVYNNNTQTTIIKAEAKGSLNSAFNKPFTTTGQQVLVLDNDLAFTQNQISTIPTSYSTPTTFGPESYTFTTDTNDIIDLLYYSGSADNENTYNLTDQSGNLVESVGRLGFILNVNPTSTFGIIACSNIDADFSANSISVCQGNSVSFTDLSTGSPSSWFWDFGDGSSSILQNPNHTFFNIGAYNVSLITTGSNGVDTLTKTNYIIVNNNSTGTDIQSSCTSYIWLDGITYTSSNNTATQTLTNVYGCDSVVTLDLTITYPTINTINISECNSYSLNGQNFTSTGTYVQNLTNASGCDSILTLNLVISSNTGIDTQVACNSYTWIDGNTYSSSTNTATFMLQNTAGCDSLVTLNLSINNNAGTDTQIACNNYIWIDGNNYTSNNNTAVFTLQNSNGCDSVVTLNLTINYESAGLDVQTVCNNFTWIDGNTYTSSNNSAVFILQNSQGCDSIVTLNLTVLNSSSNSISATNCNSYSLNGQIYTSSGTYVQNLTNAIGCDSIITLNLTIPNSNSGVTNKLACNSYTWIDGVIYTSSNNTATYTLQNSVGCDSLVTLNLTILNNTGTDSQFACNSYTWIDGNTYSSNNNTATYTLQNAAGCDSVVTLNLTVNYENTGTDSQVACNSYTWIDGNTYSSNNNTSTYVLQNTTGCDSIVTLDLSINQIVSTVIQNFNTIEASASNGTPPYSYLWTTGETTSTITPTINGIYGVVATDSDNCIGDTTLFEVNFVNTTGIKQWSNNLTVYPNPTKENITITIESFNGTIKTEVYDLLGNRLQISNQYTISLKNYSRGIYLIRVAYGEKTKEVKVIKH